MKIVSWNCKGKFIEDFKEIEKLHADIYVIQECTRPEPSNDKKLNEYFEFAERHSFYWIGNEPLDGGPSPIGLGIFVKKDENIGVEFKNDFREDFKYFIHLEVNDLKDDMSFDLLGVWAMPKYVEMIHDFFDENEELFNKNLIMCGDFNSNVRFDNEHRKKDDENNPKNHTFLDKKLNKKGLFSIYHKLSGECNGHESRFTFFRDQHLNYPFYLDYVYANEELIKKTELKYQRSYPKGLPNSFQILDHRKWICLSDHLPLVFEINKK